MTLLITSTIFIYFILLIILILNISDKSKIIKCSFTIFIIVLLVALFFANELVMDYLISMFIRYIYYPTFASLILTVLITMVIFLRNVFYDRLNDKRRIINYIFANLIFVGYIFFMLQDVNINSYNSLYGDISLFCIRYITRTFILWQIVNLGIAYFGYFARKR